MGTFVTLLLMPPFNLLLLHEKLDDDLAELQATSTTMMMMMKTTMTTTLLLPSAEVYKIQEKFAKKDQYWIDDVWTERFDTALEEGILFCPAVVNELVPMIEKCLAERTRQGLIDDQRPAGNRKVSLDC